MAAIVRVKRRQNEEPVDSLVLVCKKQKLDGVNDEIKDFQQSQETVHRIESKFKFAGTIEQIKDNSTTQTVRKAIRKRKLENERNKFTGETALNNKNMTKSVSKGYTIIGHKTAKDFDSLANDENDTSSNDSKYFLFDIEKSDEFSNSRDKTQNEICCNGKLMTREKITDDGHYVYDLYYMNDYKFDFSLLQNVESVEAYRETYDFQYFEESEDIYDDEDDENEESNWRNDYPDEYLCFYEPDDDCSNGSSDDNDDLSYIINRCEDDESPEISAIETKFSGCLKLSNKNKKRSGQLTKPNENSLYNFYKQNYLK